MVRLPPLPSGVLPAMQELVAVEVLQVPWPDAGELLVPEVFMVEAESEVHPPELLQDVVHRSLAGLHGCRNPFA